MDRYEGLAYLEWWVNRSTCLARTPVRLTVTTDGDAWQMSALIEPPLAPAGHEEWLFLLEASPYATLVVSDDVSDHVEVQVEQTANGRLVLTAL